MWTHLRVVCVRACVCVVCVCVCVWCDVCVVWCVVYVHVCVWYVCVCVVCVRVVCVRVCVWYVCVCVCVCGVVCVCAFSLCVCRNMLYISPQALDFRSGKGRNIGIRVQFMSGEEGEDACCNIYGKSCSPMFQREAWVPVLYHNRYVDMVSAVPQQVCRYG